MSKYYNENKELFHSLNKKWREENPIRYRAIYLRAGYIREDRKHKRGESNLTVDWIIENIFSKPCAHCGKKGWDVIGCNRLDNSKPHTMDNVEPCCWECNRKLGDEYKRKIRNKIIYQYTKNGELINVWSSVNEAGRNGFDARHIYKCCKGERKTHKGFRWSYEPL